MKIIFIVLFIICLHSYGFAQDNGERERGFWTQYGFTLYGAKQSGGGGLFEGHYQKGSNLFSLRFVDGGELLRGENPGSEIVEYGILYGRCRRAGSKLFSSSIGIGYVNIRKRDRNEYHTVGLLAEVQYVFAVFKYVGFGIKGMGNLNSKYSYAGVGISIDLGQMK